MEKKMTYVEAIENALQVVTDVETKEKLEALKSTLIKRKTNKKATKTQVENEVLKEVILEVLGTLGKVTVSKLQKSDERLEELSNQKVSALLRQLKDAGLVDKVADKKSTLYFVVG